jgi:hypothetical protein
MKPQLWKLQTYNGTDPLVYSNPGIFLTEWMKREKEKQDRDSSQRIARKAYKKDMKIRRRERLREYQSILEEELAARAREDAERELMAFQMQYQLAEVNPDDGPPVPDSGQQPNQVSSSIRLSMGRTIYAHTK